MKAETDLQELIQKVERGVLNKYLTRLSNSDFGIYVPAFVEGGVVRKMLAGYSQTEKNLVVSVGRREESRQSAGLQVGWFGARPYKDSTCRHEDKTTCAHCTIHNDRCRHCSHPRGSVSIKWDAPELRYSDAVSQIPSMQDLLESLAQEQFGLTLLHSHSDKHMFCKLPVDHVSVVVDGQTSFRPAADMVKNPNFVPNAWRSVDDRWAPAGGFLLD